MNSLITVKTVRLPSPSDVDKRADEQRLIDELGMGNVEIPLTLLRRISAYKDQEFSCIILRERNGYRLVDIGTDRSYSIAMDLGTTNIVLALFDNISQEVVSELKIENPQIEFGSDILTRMHHFMLGRDEELNRYLIHGINSAIKKMCRDGDLESRDIHAFVAAGNTVMSHFFLGLDVSTIPVEPFVPVVRKPGFIRAFDLNLDVNPAASVYVFPNAGSYVGGDIIAGIFASGMLDSDEPCVLIDVGTNAEIVIGNRDWMLVGAGAAGPALEEGIAGIGKRAESGIVYDVEIREGLTVCSTFNDAPPAGICGSGMVSLIYEMHESDIIGHDGILDIDQDGVSDRDGEKIYALSCESGAGLQIKQTEIDNFLSSKAAMLTLLLVLFRSVGLGFGDVKKVYVAGALGTGIDAKKAAGIGMLPSWSSDIIEPIGNGSLKGALMFLKDSSLLDREDEVTDAITYKHMHDDPEFMKEFRGGRFIPHTNPDLLKV